MTRVVGIDFSTTSTGIAIYDVNGWSTYTVKSSGKATDSLRTYYGRVRAIAAQALSIIQPMPGDVIVIEAPIVAGRRNKSEVRLHFAWHRFVEHLLAWSPDMADPIEVAPSTVKLRGAGSGRADKKAMHAAVVERLGFSPRTADEADAVWIAFVGAEDSGVRIQVKPLPARAAKKGMKS